MKRFSIIMLTFCILFAFAGCSSSKPESELINNPAISVENTESKENKDTVKKSVEAVAEYLGFTDGEEQYYSMIGATAGKAYNNGELEIYLFDDTSDSYKIAIEGGGLVKADAYKDGIILVFPNNIDQNIIDKFNEIEF